MKSPVLRRLSRLFKRSQRPLLLPGEKGIIVMPTSTEAVDVARLAPQGLPAPAPRCGPWVDRADGSSVCQKCGDVDYPGTGPMGF